MTEMNKTEDFRLEGMNLLLRPVTMEDIQGYRAIAFDESLWRYTPTKVTPDNLHSYIQTGINDFASGKKYMFTVIDKESDQIIGSTSLANIDLHSKRAEIGWTWLGVDFQHRGFNQRCKYLLLNFGFEKLDLHRIEFKTDVNNLTSRNALKKIGAVEEGILRQHTLLSNGKWRDSIYYSILSSEWPVVKNRLLALCS